MEPSDWISHILINYRWIFVLVFLMPLSILYEAYFYVYNWAVFKLYSNPTKHKSKVSGVQLQVGQWIKNGKRTKMCTARPGWRTMSFRTPKYKSMLRTIDMNNLVDIFEVNETKGTVKMEPLVTMGQLTATLLKIGWTVPVVPELDDLTVGGLVVGEGIESSSHKYGLFQDTVLSLELVMPDGSLLVCSREKNADLFYSIPWSHGTIGFLTAVELKMIPMKPYVRLEYIPVFGMEEINKTFSEESGTSSHDFVEGIMFSPQEAVVMTGTFTSDIEQAKVNPIGRWYKPWFYKHVESFLTLRSSKSSVEYIPLRDYYHRHTRSIFWELQDIISFGNNPIFRFLLGWAVPPKISLLKLTQPPSVKTLYENNHMIQDMLVPMSSLKDSLKIFDQAVKIFPLWLCPFKCFLSPGLVHPKGKDPELYVDIGAYGTPGRDSFSPRGTTRLLEAFVRSVNGFQMLYADTYMSRNEFREMFDHKLYDKVRSEHGASEAFPELYDKVARHARS